MRGSVLLVVLGALATSGCTRLNPSFSEASEASDTDTAPKPDATSAATTGESTGESGVASSGASGSPSPSASDTGPVSGTGGTTLCPEVLGTCDAYAEDTCPDGKRCRPWSDGSNSGVGCVAQLPAALPVELGEACTHRCDAEYGVDDCPDRSICDPFSNRPTCVPLCGTEGTCEDGVCEPHEDYGICRSLMCDPILQDCPDGFGCYLEGMCAPAGSLGPGSQCSVLNDCQAGLVCISSMTADCNGLPGTCCAPLCDPERSACEPGQQCLDVGDGVAICVAT